MNLLKIALGLFFLVLFQGISLSKPFVRIQKSQALQNLAIGALNLTLIALLLSPWLSAPPQRDLNLFLALPRIAILILAFDALSYFWHRANHQFSFLWQWHKTHHQESVIDTTTAYRFHPIEVLFSLAPKWLLLWVLGATWQELILFEIIFTASNLFQHSNFRIPQKIDRLLLKIITTPSLHRRHHSINPADQHKNYGTIFSFWDRIFKSYAENLDEKIIHMGLDTNPTTPSI